MPKIWPAQFYAQKFQHPAERMPALNTWYVIHTQGLPNYGILLGWNLGFAALPYLVENMHHHINPHMSYKQTSQKINGHGFLLENMFGATYPKVQVRA